MVTPDDPVKRPNERLLLDCPDAPFVPLVEKKNHHHFAISIERDDDRRRRRIAFPVWRFWLLYSARYCVTDWAHQSHPLMERPYTARIYLFFHEHNFERIETIWRHRNDAKLSPRTMPTKHFGIVVTSKEFGDNVWSIRCRFRRSVPKTWDHHGYTSKSLINIKETFNYIWALIEAHLNEDKDRFD